MLPMLEKTLRAIALTGIFALPFIVFYVASSLFFPFITGKNFAFRIIVEVMTGAWLALALVFPKYRPRRSWMLAAFALFVIVMAIADAQGANPFKSFWSNYERMDGWVTLAHLFAYFTVALSMLDSEKLWRRLLHTVLGVSVLVSCYGLLQLAGLVTINQGGVRLDATFGNATYLAVYMLFNIFIAAFYLADAWVEKGKEKGPGKRAGAMWLYGSIIALDFLILFFTATRGALLGLLGGAVLATLLLIAQAPRSRTAWRAGVGILAVAVLAVAFWFNRDAAWIEKVEPLHRLATISLSDNTTKSRFMNIGMAVKGFEERPAFGWGQENYAIVFDKYYDPGMYAQEPWFDRVHNIVFDWLVAGGILGLLAYLSLYACALWCLWRTRAFNPAERSILTGLLAGYFFYLLFTFDNITSYILFVTVLAFIAGRASEAKDSPRLLGDAVLSHRALPIVAALSVILVWSAAWYVNAAAIAQNRTLLSALASQGDVTKNLMLFERAVSYRAPGLQEAREQLAQGVTVIARNEGIHSDIKRKFFDLAVAQMSEQEKASPLDARSPLFLGILYDAYGQYDAAHDALERAHTLSPGKQAIFFQLAQNAALRSDTSAMLDYLKTAFELDPAYNDARSYYAVALIQAGDIAHAREILAPVAPSKEALEQFIAQIRSSAR